MVRKIIAVYIGIALLFVSAADAMSGHCAASDAMDASVAMSEHCMEMMTAELPEKPGQNMSSDNGFCCCAAMTAPILFKLTGFADTQFSPSSWSKPVNTNGQSIPVKVAIPPPRI